jgi:hypothetical protein
MSTNFEYFEAWWNHKLNNKWILAGLIQCMSKMTPEDWNATPSSTNIGEGAHHFTNGETGVNLSPLEAILT